MDLKTLWSKMNSNLYLFLNLSISIYKLDFLSSNLTFHYFSLQHLSGFIIKVIVLRFFKSWWNFSLLWRKHCPQISLQQTVDKNYYFSKYPYFERPYNLKVIRKLILNDQSSVKLSAMLFALKFIFLNAIEQPTSRINKLCFGDFYLLRYQRLNQEDLNIINSLLFKLLRQNESNLDFKMTPPPQVIQIMIVTYVKSHDANISFRCSFHVIYSSTIFLKWLLSARHNARCWVHKDKLGILGPGPLGPQSIGECGR